jgi:hypothetical protein
MFELVLLLGHTAIERVESIAQNCDPFLHAFF